MRKKIEPTPQHPLFILITTSVQRESGQDFKKKLTGSQKALLPEMSAALAPYSDCFNVKRLECAANYILSNMSMDDDPVLEEVQVIMDSKNSALKKCVELLTLHKLKVFSPNTTEDRILYEVTRLLYQPGSSASQQEDLALWIKKVLGKMPDRVAPVHDDFHY